ncbi:UDP-N-acetylmuramoyl-L-alanine--D-glutamate ligase [Jatrophihabitans telluris]|uniref:UDP-N-acetylmuramoylalanine--D-glutamate ligase n=1 Tax=Jatrophihabitans telluris TaxID=2038343 RepID=A0ABY4QUR0_9ACTN|nr:UDP-N-acetylmuramoyl-L-alanine--D-glutamate ligase [Jatrophihabitans telluris]UQX87190.1 UDP-N-acetylmuramoyl-L-alanine--D-glutamate ligase [Jatrophihabitans telluris]
MTDASTVPTPAERAASSPRFADRLEFAGARALVLGARVAGASAARALVRLGCSVLVTDAGPARLGGGLPEGAEFLGAVEVIPDGIDLVVTSPGLRPDQFLLQQAYQRGLPVFGELEFAWRIRGNDPAAWLMITGTNGKTTTVRMLEAVLRSAGLRALAVGNVGVPIIDAVLADPGYDVLAVEASSFQLHHSATIAPLAGALLNVAPDHLDWHGTMSAYAREKTKVFAGDTAIGNADDPTVLARLEEAATSRLTFSTHHGGPGSYGVVDGLLRDAQGRVLLPAAEIRPPGEHNVANALAAAALAETAGVGPEQIAAGLRAFVPDPHRNQLVATVSDVDYVDDSKATNPHAADASLAAYPSVVWIAGGQLKGAPIAELVDRHAPRLRAAVLLGQDRDLIASALARHAPDVPVITVSRTDDGAMQEVVAAAASLAHASDVVLLAPAGASLDMFASYSARGESFARAVGQLPGAVTGPVPPEQPR